jgi:hypothetical protein
MINASFLWAGFDPSEPPPSEEYKWILIRNYRNERLSDCDWSQLGDAPFSAEEKNAWTAYRQSLRDIPEDYANAGDVMFPDAPGSIQPSSQQA